MAVDKIKVGMVGVGNFGAARRHAMRASGLYTIVAAYDINPEALAHCCRQEDATAADNYEALLETPGIEAMVISTGAKFHAEQTLQALDCGLHVFVEKPLCSTEDEVTALLAKQRETGLVVGLGHSDHTQDPVSTTIKRLIDDGELGAVASFDAMTSHTGGLQIKPGDWRGDPEKNPGGMLFQCGVHKLHELAYYFGRVVRVSARMRYDVHTTGTADVAICHLEYESGLIGCLNAYHVVPYCHRLNIFGTKANLYRDDRFFDEGTSLNLQRETPDNPGAKQPLEAVDFRQGSSVGGRDGGMHRFHAAIRTGAKMYPSIEDGAQAVQIVFAAEKSAKTGRVVDIAL